MYDLEKSISRFIRRTNWGAVCYGIAALLIIACVGAFGAAESDDMWWAWMLGELVATAFFCALGMRESERYHYRETVRRNEAFEKRRKREKALAEIRTMLQETCETGVNVRM